MSLDLDPSVLLLELVTSGIGLVLFVYGKKQQRWPQLVTGLLFMVYPYFVSGFGMMVGVGALLGAALWLAVRAGY